MHGPSRRLPNFSAHISAKEHKHIFFHLIRNMQSVRALYATHSSPGSNLGLKVKRIVSQRCTIRALLTSHVQFALLLSAMLKTWLITLASRFQRNTFRAVNIGVGPPATHPFAQCLFDPLCAFPITLKTYSSTSKTYMNGKSQSFPPPHHLERELVLLLLVRARPP